MVHMPGLSALRSDAPCLQGLQWESVLWADPNGRSQGSLLPWSLNTTPKPQDMQPHTGTVCHTTTSNTRR